MYELAIWALEMATAARLDAAALRLAPGAAGRLTDSPADGAALYQNIGGTAIIPVVGMLTPAPTGWGWLLGSETTHTRLRAALAAALGASDVQRIVLAWSSPGGPTAGLQGLADDVRAADARKPVYSFTESLMASAAYFVGCQARRVIVSPEGLMGSIGTLWMMYDDSEQFKQLGVQAYTIRSAPLKGIGQPGTKFTKEQQAELQQLVNNLGAVFKSAVMRGRGLTAQRVEDLADGGMLVGAAAVAAGLADRVATLAQLLDEIGGGAAVGGVGTNLSTQNDGRSGRPRSAAGGPQDKETAMDWVTWLRARGLDPGALAPADETRLRGEFETEQRAAASAAPPAPAAPPLAGSVPPTAPTSAAPAELDVQRTAEVLDSVERLRRARRAQIRGEAAGLNLPESVIAQAQDDCADVAEARAMFLRELRSRRSPSAGAPAIIIHDRQGEATAEVLATGLMLRAGLRVVDPQATETTRRRQEQIAEVAHRYRAMSMVDMCGEALRLAGRPVPIARDERIMAAVTTAELGGVFTSVVNAQLVQAYQEAPDSTVGWVSEAEVPDFKTNERHNLGTAPSLKRLPRGGEAKHAGPDEFHEDYKVQRFAEQFAVDEQDMVDDRLNALTEAPRLYGNAARRLRPDLVYSILLANANMSDGVALFHATHANLTSAALAAGTLQTALTMMSKQTRGGAILNILSRFLIVAQAVRFTARQLVTSSEVRDNTSSLNYGTRNPIQDEQLQIRADARIDSGVIDPVAETLRAGAATKWFLAAGANEYPTIEVGYLTGTGRQPTLRSYVLTQGRWGIGFDVKMDIGAKALDWRGLVYSPGT